VEEGCGGNSSVVLIVYLLWMMLRYQDRKCKALCWRKSFVSPAQFVMVVTQMASQSISVKSSQFSIRMALFIRHLITALASF
jgi:hypothetical protein